MTKPPILAPYKNGELQHYARKDHDDIEWRPIQPTVMTLALRGTVRGQSAAYFMWVDIATAEEHPMFITDMVTVVSEAPISGGIVTGRWQPTKRGQNYGIKWIGAAT